MAKYKPGDYIISKDKEIYRITKVSFNNIFYSSPLPTYYYDIKGLTKKVNYFNTLFYENIEGLSEQELENIGSIIPEESATEMFKILYK